MPKIGDTVWVHSEYESPLSPDTQRDIFHIIGETTRSWKITWKPTIYGYQLEEFFTVQKKSNDKGEHWTAKLGSRNGARWRVYLTRDELNEAIAAREREVTEGRWLEAHRDNIAHAVRSCRDRRVLEQVAALVGYEITAADFARVEISRG